MIRFAAFLLTAGMAASTWAASDFVPINRTISKLFTFDTQVIVEFTPTFNSTQGCSTTRKDRVAIDMSARRGRALYAALLVAHTMDQKVGFAVADCLGPNPEAYRVDLAN